MKVTKTVHVPAHDATQVVGYRCDFPGCENDTDPAGIYEVNECEVRVYVKHREGENYPEGGSGTEVEVDICPKCFKEKLLPWLESQGVKVERKDWEW